MNAHDMAQALIDLWEVEGGECDHGHDLTDCPVEGCRHEPLRPFLAEAKLMVEGEPSVWHTLDLLFARYDGGIEVDCASLCLWSARMYLVMTNPEDRASRSMTFFGVDVDPESAARRVLADALDWLADGNEPIRPDFYVKGDG